MKRRSRRRRALNVVLALGLAGSSIGFPATARSQVTPDRGVALERALRIPTDAALRSHVRFLSHDLLLGRGPGSAGGQLAASYIAAQFEAMGLQGGAADGSYMQPVPLVGARADATLIIGAQRQTVPLDPRRDFVAWPVHVQANVTADGEIVFVGYGIRAPEWQWDDYGTSSLNGKVLLFLAGQPGAGDTTGFADGLPTYYGTWNYKLDRAARLGAAGAIIVHSDRSGLPWQAMVATWGGERVYRVGPVESSLRFGAWVTEEAARRIALASGRDLDLLLRRAQLRSFQPIAMDAHAVTRIRSSPAPRPAANAVAVLEGDDLAHEWIVVMAHYDHLGIGPPENGDSVYNGAVDNATGVAALLETAKAFAGSGHRPRRSTMFLATAAADFGFLGARAFVNNPLVPLHQIAAVVNLDRGNVWGSTTDAVVVGASRSELIRYAVAAAERERMRLTPEIPDDIALLYGNDALPFASAGIPVMTLRSGREFPDREAHWGREQQDRYLSNRYHRPSDDFTTEFVFGGLLQQVRLAIRLGWMLGSTDAFPAWAPGSEFKAAGDQLRLRRLRDSRPPSEPR